MSEINPAHYRRSKDTLGVEVIDILEFFFPDDPLLWQVGKYLLRAGHKDDLGQDLGKLIWYAERRISKHEGGRVSDVSKTNEELIAEARKAEAFARANSYGQRSHVDLVTRLADALEAFTCALVQGEPDDDREVLVRQERAKLVAVRDVLNRDDFGDDWEHDEWVYRQASERKLADIEEVLGSVMLAVPDAATEELNNLKSRVDLREFEIDCLDDLITEIKTERDAARAEIESRIDDRDYWYGISNKAKSQRDAATEAIERVRAAIRQYPHYGARSAVESALDGAPEPDSITIPRPVVPFGPVSKAENEATADYLLEVVKKIDGKYCTVGGSNVTATVRKLLLEVADAVRGLPVEGESKP